MEVTLSTEQKRLCPVCGNLSDSFMPHGIVSRDDARCPHCHALERHRFAWLFFQRKTDLFDGLAKKMLHVAPEGCFEPKLKALLAGNYLTADLQNPRAMVAMDITNILYPNETFDVIYCSHVLEHVPDDRRAIREFYRVLKHDGWAVISVPVASRATFEDPSIVDPCERLRVFGQKDHVRIYGPDFVDRLREVGFSVEVSRVCNVATPAETSLMGLKSGAGRIYYCRKQYETK